MLSLFCVVTAERVRAQAPLPTLEHVCDIAAAKDALPLAVLSDHGITAVHAVHSLSLLHDLGFYFCYDAICAGNDRSSRAFERFRPTGALLLC